MKVTRTSVTQQIIDYIKENIENGTWPVGSKIMSEPDLALELGVSRPSVRIAIRQFIALGILESIRGKGTFVRSLPNSSMLSEKPIITGSERIEMDKILEFRMLVEPYAAYMAAKSITEEGVQKLQKYYAMMKASINDPELYFTADMRFHETIVESLGNEYVDRYTKFLFAETFQAHVHIRMQLGYKPGLYYHQLIMEAIMHHNQEMAYNTMREHLQMKYNHLPPASHQSVSETPEADQPSFPDLEQIHFARH